MTERLNPIHSHEHEAEDEEEELRKSLEWKKSGLAESLDFDESESIVWRKHHLRRFFQEKNTWWNQSRRSTVYKWALVVYIGFIVACAGSFVVVFTLTMFDWKFDVAYSLLENEETTKAFFAFTGISMVLALLASLLCVYEPATAGAGITEVKAFLNGVNLKKFVRIQVFYCKCIGMCFSVASGLPLGKEGPMIHCGAIIGAAVSQGRTNFFGFDTSWTKYQALRNDLSKRDFVTFGAAAGIAAAFRSPIGGIMFTLEEGASFWSNTVTFRGFFCALVTVLMIQILFLDNGTNDILGMYQFGTFVEFNENTPNYHLYELAIFALVGVFGGVLGAVFNHINLNVLKFRGKYVQTLPAKIGEVMLITFLWCGVSFILPLLWHTCTDLPTQTADWTASERELLNELVQFSCPSGQYNQVASLFFCSSDIAMQQLFHFREYDGSEYTSFSTGAILMFFFPYFGFAAWTAGSFIPAGLFIPTLVAGSAYGRLIGHLLNVCFPGFVADSGTYALIGAAAVLGGMSRMTIAGTVIVLEACGNSTYLLPLMITFAGARYTGNAINEGIYDMQMKLRKYPFLEGNIGSMGLLNYHPISEVMATPVVTLHAIEQVSKVFDVLKHNTHNGFPVVDADGTLRGFILRKTLCSLLKFRVFSSAVPVELPGPAAHGKQEMQLSTAATVFWDTMERDYPKYPTINDVKLSSNDFSRWVDIRAYMDTAPYTADESSSIQRVYRYFRTMGLRHLTILNQHHVVTGIITRQDIVEHRLEHHSFDEDGQHFQRHVAVDNSVPRVVYENDDVVVYSGNMKDPDAVRLSAATNRDSTYYSNPFDATGGSVLHTRESLATIQQEQLMDSSELGTSAMIMRKSSLGASMGGRTSNHGSHISSPALIGRNRDGSVTSSAPQQDVKAPTNSTTSRVNREPKGANNQW